MLYVKPDIEIIRFNPSKSFMAYSGGDSGRAAAIQDALNDTQILEELSLGNRYHIEEPVYYLNGQWYITVTVYNHGGQAKLQKSFVI